jgi:intein/homing endonuclease
MSAISGFISTVSNTITGIASNIMNAISGAITTLSNMITGITTAISNTISGFIDTVSKTLSGIAKNITDSLSTVAKSLSDTISGFTKSISDAISTMAKGIMDNITGIGKSILDIYNFIVNAFQNMASQVGAGFQVIGNTLMGFINGVLQVASEVKILSLNLSNLVTLFDELQKAIIEVFSNPLKWLSEKLILPASNLVSHLWNSAKSLFDSILKQISDVFSKIWETITSTAKAVSDTIIDTIQKLWSMLVKPKSPELGFYSESFEKFVYGIYNPVQKMMVEQAQVILIDQFTPVLAEFAYPIAKDKVSVELMKLWTFSISMMFFPIIGQIPVRLASWTTRAIARSLSGLDWNIRINLRPLGLGVDTQFNLAKALGATLHETASNIEKWLDEVGRGLVYGYAIWFSRPIAKLGNMIARNFIPVEIPRDEILLESLRRSIPHKTFDEKYKYTNYFLAIQGYSDYVIDLLMAKEDKLNIEVTDRFGTKRKIPLSILYELPSASDVATMMVRDIFASIEDFQKLYQARGMAKDIGALYYFLRFRYPPPEKLWQFTMRGISGLLWATLPEPEKADIRKEIEAMGAIMPTSPVELNFKTDILMTAFKTYMKWHDYFRGCILEGELILGDNKPIETYEVGDHTLLGGKVEATYRKHYRGKAVKIKAYDILELKVTPEHIIPVVRLARKWIIENGRDSFKLVPVEIVYKHADKIEPAPKTHITHYNEGDYLLVPVLKGEVDVKELSMHKYLKQYTNVRRLTLPLDEDVAWFMGFYVAEGCSQDKYISVSQSEENKEIINKVCAIINKLGYRSVVSKHRGIVEIYIKSPILARAFSDWFGKGAENKKIPDFILHHKDINIVKAFIEGYVAGDGHIRNNSDEVYLYTVSKTLALQLQLLLLRLGYIAGISYREKENGYKIWYTVHEHKNKLVRRLSEFTGFSESIPLFKHAEDYLLAPVSEVEFEDYEGSVYDLQVENDHFLVSNVVVHNSWIQGFTSDNLIYIDTLADIPTKIDMRWMVKWGVYELFSAKGVTYESTVREFATKIIEPNAVSQVQMDLTNFSRTLQATGIHPDWIPATAVAEAMNSLTEERTALRTGFISLFKEGFYDVTSLETLLAGFISTSFKVAYFDITQMKWTTGWVNMPVMYLPPERKLLELRALMDRSLDILRDIQRDISTAYQEFIIWDYNEYKSRLTQVINSINEFYSKDYETITGVKLPDQLKLKFVEDYYKPYVEALKTWRDVFTIRRVRMWTQRWLGWIMYRVAYGTVEKEDVEKLVKYVGEKAKLTDYETEFIKQVMELMYGISKRTTVSEYLPTPSTLATLSEYMTLDVELVKKILVERGLPKEWQDIWLTYITVRPIKSDARNLLSAYIRALRYGVVTRDVVDNYIKTLPKYGFTDREISFITESVNLEEQIIEARTSRQEYIPTPSMLATICEYIPEARKFFDAVVKARRIPQEWQAIWAKYIDIRPLVDDIKRYLSRAEQLYVRFMIKQDDFKKILNEASSYLGYTPKELEFLMKVTEFERYRNAWTELIGSVERLVSLSEYSPRASKYALGKLYEMIDALPLSDDEKKELKAMWEEYIRNRPVKSEARTYITQLINLYVDGLISGDAFKKELQEMKNWGFSDAELMFYEAQASLRRARKLRIPVGE